MLESHAEAINEEVQRQVQEKISALNLKSPEKPKSPERRSAGNAKPSLPTSQQLATMTATDIYALLDTASPTKQEIISSRLRAIASISEINENRANTNKRFGNPSNVSTAKELIKAHILGAIKRGWHGQDANNLGAITFPLQLASKSWINQASEHLCANAYGRFDQKDLTAFIKKAAGSTLGEADLHTALARLVLLMNEGFAAIPKETVIEKDLEELHRQALTFIEHLQDLEHVSPAVVCYAFQQVTSTNGLGLKKNLMTCFVEDYSLQTYIIRNLHRDGDTPAQTPTKRNAQGGDGGSPLKRQRGGGRGNGGGRGGGNGGGNAGANTPAIQNNPQPAANGRNNPPPARNPAPRRPWPANNAAAATDPRCMAVTALIDAWVPKGPFPLPQQVCKAHAKFNNCRPGCRFAHDCLHCLATTHCTMDCYYPKPGHPASFLPP